MVVAVSKVVALLIWHESFERDGLVNNGGKSDRKAAFCLPVGVQWALVFPRCLHAAVAYIAFCTLSVAFRRVGIETTSRVNCRRV